MATNTGVINTRTVRKTQRAAAQRNWSGLAMWLTGLALVFGVSVTVWATVLGLRWFNQPWLGVLYSPNLTINGTKTLVGAAWNGYAPDKLQTFDRIIAISFDDASSRRTETFDGSATAGPKLVELLANRRPAQAVTVQVNRPGQFRVPIAGCTNYTTTGATCTIELRLSQMPLGDFALQFGAALGVAVAALVMGGLLWQRKRDNYIARLVIALCSFGAVALVGRFDAIATFGLPLLWLFSFCMVSGIFAQLGLVYPYPFLAAQNRSWLRNVFLALPVALLGLSLVVYFAGQTGSFYDAPQLVGVTGLLISGVFLISSQYFRYRRSVAPILREQSAVILLATSLAIIPAALWLITVVIERWTGISNLTFSSIFIIPTILLLPVGFIYTLSQANIDSDRLITQGLTYSALGLMLIVGYGLIVSAAVALTQNVIQADNPFIIALVIFVVAVAFTPARLRLEAALETAFFRARRQYDTRLEAFARKLTMVVDVEDVTRLLQNELQGALAPQHIAVFLRNITSSDFEALPDPVTGKVMTDIRFKAESGLVGLFESDTSILRIDAGETPPIRIAAERARLMVLNAQVIARLRSSRRLNGFVALAARHNRMEYGFLETNYIQNVCEQAAAAYERAQMIVEARRNEQELKVLSSVSAALNIPMEFDTLLEFVYAQVDRVIPAENFYIVFRDANTDELIYAFYQEDGERLSEKEGYRWPLGRDLFSDVIRTQQGANTDNYVRETQRRDSRMRIENHSLRAWMAVPLNAGENATIGCLALATTDPSVIYTADQMRIFWDIASLAATAIFKARLFTETEERGRQMKVLNDISSRLAAAFENIEELLAIIIQSSVEILNCEAGSLLLRDPFTGDLIFSQAIGGAGTDLIGKRIPGTGGIAGEVVATGRPQIVNDTQQDARWLGEIGDNGGDRSFRTLSILAVPLSARGQVVGVLELINKRDGTTFSENDVELLATFASQAAVAIENARLYKSTDEQLALRVQQLDSMQRIDQELNRTLNLDEVILLTIQFAIEESSADAGALLLVAKETGRFELAGQVNYPDGAIPVGLTLAIGQGIIGRVHATQQLWVQQDEFNPPYDPLLPNAHSQLAVPLITGAEVIGILLLESVAPLAFGEQTINQIQALAEHANTAITNAQLYTQLTDSNSARSKFVGFVAHELKNPMSSIKGYSEVLLGGLTGALSDQQQNFITIIRRNVVRMQQLVDDLKDLVAQETGNLTLRLAPVSFQAVILESIRPQQRAFDEKEQKVTLNVPETLPPVWGDELRLIQVMTNFISNANKYTPQNGVVTVTAEVRPNVWDSSLPGNVLYCAVTDTGIGMDDHDLAELFTPYWRSTNPRAQEQPGTGLGMTLTRGLVEAHRGRLWVESVLNVGTTFHFYVPLASTIETPPERDSERTSTRLPERGTDRTLLRQSQGVPSVKASSDPT